MTYVPRRGRGGATPNSPKCGEPSCPSVPLSSGGAMTEYPSPTNPPRSAMSPLPSSATAHVPVTDRASDAAQAAKNAGADLAQTAGEKAKDVGAETGKQARDLLGEAREQVRQQAGSQHRSLV